MRFTFAFVDWMGSCQFDLESFVHRLPPFPHCPPGLTVVGRRRGAGKTGVGVSRHPGEGAGDSLAPKNSSVLVLDLYGMLNVREVRLTIAFEKFYLPVLHARFIYQRPNNPIDVLNPAPFRSSYKISRLAQ